MIALGAAAALVGLLRLPSENVRAAWLGYSSSRLAVAALTGLLVLVFAFCTLAEGAQLPFWIKLSAKARAVFSRQGNIYWLAVPGLTILLVDTLLLVAALSPLAQAEPLLASLLQRMGLLWAWIDLAVLLLGWMALRNFKPSGPEPVFTPLRWALLALVISLTFGVLIHAFNLLAGSNRFRQLEYYLQAPALIGLALALLQRYFSGRAWYGWVSKTLSLALVAAAAVVLFVATAKLVGWYGTPAKVYWNLLADAFLKGRLYLVDPPTTHDLTLYNGNWYVPNPPLPALAVLPLVAVLGVQGVNMVWFSILIAAAIVALVFWILQDASAQGLIPTGLRSNLWLTVMFALGTDYWWLSFLGQMWFLSQLLTLLCAALAVLFVIKKASPWWAGLWLGLALLSRPNIFTLWPLLAGLYLYLDHRGHPTFDWKRALGWAIQSAVPVVLAAAILLVYNYVRFGNFMDFGYTTINGAAEIVTNVQTYGIFNIHFVPINLKVMFLDFPRFALENGCHVLNTDGFSMLVMTPALLYVFRRFRWNAWTIGAWISIILSIGLLAFYHNTGSAQVGFRYLMDFILPVLLLMGIGLGKKPEWPFKALVLLGIAGNFVGILLWFRLLCY